ncbi:MAG: UDP-N-acetylmuramate dehydrogenase [Desulfobacteraceae bacterium]|nr:UDP-N-acetylmuramate dehydrogenase [Desulfobacteraceae bacterium]
MLTSGFKKMLAELLGERVGFDVPMAAHTSFKVGGPADALAAPADSRQLIDLMVMLEDSGVDWFVLGGGTNLLVKDSGIRGVVISLKQGFSKIKAEKTGRDSVLVHAGAGARLSALCRYALENNLAGMNFALGIPGTVGGAVIMNAGTGLGTMESVLAGIDVLYVPDKPGTVHGSRVCFDYRGLVWDDSIITEGGRAPIILAGRFELEPAGDRDQSAEAESLQAWRRQSQPTGLSAGCVFKNPSPQIPAGKLIDQAGLKGLQIGDAQVSEVHANFIVNLGRASASDILRLTDTVRQKVLKAHGVELEPEIKIIGE